MYLEILASHSEEHFIHGAEKKITDGPVRNKRGDIWVRWNEVDISNATRHRLRSRLICDREVHAASSELVRARLEAAPAAEVESLDDFKAKIAAKERPLSGHQGMVMTPT